MTKAGEPGFHENPLEAGKERFPLTFDGLKAASLFPQSQDLPEQVDTDLHAYTATRFVFGGREVVGEYECIQTAERIAQQTPDKAKFDFRFSGSPNLGWKAHITTSLIHTPDVGVYLIENGYRHKFLSGGDVAEGKVFTIYFGSKKMVDRWAATIAKDLEGKLARPNTPQEVELARGIAGRFSVREKNHASIDTFTPYGQLGIPLLRSRARVSGDTLRYVNHPTEAELQEAFETLRNEFGEYFTG